MGDSLSYLDNLLAVRLNLMHFDTGGSFSWALWFIIQAKKSQ